MPTYDYTCSNCGDFEYFQKMTSEPLTACPSCGDQDITRHIGAGGAIIFKGDGFYCTDYKKKKREKDERKS